MGQVLAAPAVSAGVVALVAGGAAPAVAALALEALEAPQSSASTTKEPSCTTHLLNPTL